MESKSPQMSELINMESPEDVFDEVKKIVLTILPQFDFVPVDLTFRNVLRLFQGLYPGYRACDTNYHNLKHTTDTFLSMARIIHGATITNLHFSEKSVALGLVSALLHDSGYILTLDDEGPGARYTLVHISRSIKFMEKYFETGDFSKEDFTFCRAILNCTGLDVKIDAIQFESQENANLGKMLGTADLLGQMADRTYLEKLAFLYDEFKIANIKELGTELDFLRDTPKFVDMSMNRFKYELGDIIRYMHYHFRARWGIDKDLYISHIENTIEYLKYILEHHPGDHRRHLRRTGTIRNLKRIRGEGIDGTFPCEKKSSLSR